MDDCVRMRYLRSLLPTRWMAVAAVVLSLSSCERPVPFVDGPGEEMDGYGIEGKVMTSLGQPLEHVAVLMSYDLQYLDSNPPPPREYVVPPPGQFVTVAVYDSENRIVRTIAAQQMEAGSTLVLWDQLDDAGGDVPAGLYEVRYMVNDEVKRKYPVIVEGTPTAFTKSDGTFLIPAGNLPIGFSPLPLYSRTGQIFYGNYRVGSEVYLEFRADSRSTSASVVLRQNRLTRLDIRLN